MTLICADLPENPDDLPGWLERQVVGYHLPDLVAELQASQGANPSTESSDLRTSLLEILGSNTDAVRTEGLSRLPVESLRRLIRRPALLLELQEWALVEGGPHWQRQLDAPASDPALATGALRLDEYLTGTLRPASAPFPSRLAWYQQPWLVSLATAACVLLAVYGVHLMTPPPPLIEPVPPVVVAKATGWGWDRPDALPQQAPAREYLEKLASAAEEWSKKRPDTAPALARRLNEFRAGCSTLILTVHEPLNERDRIWLKDRCVEWAERINMALTQLEDDTDVATVRKEVDTLVARIARTLRERAVRA